ncbi:RNA polymerase sigma-70 factor (ECF subfamily) [Rhodoglobus vestalii]|uniref:RNA polymerase sigma-70 factor (ECF subfamily) n=1 Tax=Rhodoglobus vestalii TaxID=193384 RepID=A0A8H2K6L4_9MICO|nr:sigma-70 family RNA polymerase sigma factor [Rhodoglobus vestalii]TQO20135.1 RNA polymerase sigma-70 factor (ECF subfamily) [Rhodoglobus vestalii]
MKFGTNRARVFHRALGLLANRHDAEEVVAAAFFELWRKRRAVRLVNGSILPWLLVTTVNLSRNARRATSRNERVMRTLPRTQAVSAPDAAALETKDHLTNALQRLSPADGALFILTASEDLPLAEAAEAVGLKPSTARMRLHRAVAIGVGGSHSLRQQPARLLSSTTFPGQPRLPRWETASP